MTDPPSANGSFAHQDLHGAIFHGQDLGGADFTGANLQGADLSFADLFGAKLTGADLTDATLVGARLADTVAVGANFSEACLDGANLWCADLSRCDFGKAALHQALLTDTKLCGASLDGAELYNAVLAGANLDECECNAHFGGTVLCGVNLHATRKLGHAEIARENFIDHRTIEMSARDLTTRDPKLDALVRFIEESSVGGGALDYLRRLAATHKSIKHGELTLSVGRMWNTSTLPERAVDWSVDVSLAAEGLRVLLDRAVNEREMQEFFENNPALLARCLRGGHGRWVIPHLNLGSNHQADSSSGRRTRWGTTGHSSSWRARARPSSTRAAILQRC